MIAQLKLEWILFTRSTKNRLLFILFIAAALYYGLFVAPQFTPHDSFADEETILERIEEYQYVIDTYGIERPRNFDTANMIIDTSQDQLEALREENWEEYFLLTMNVNFYIRNARYDNNVDPQFFDPNQDYPGHEETFWVAYRNNRYLAYGDGEFEIITPAMVEERTVLQTMQRLLQDNLPFILLILLVLYAVDSLTKNKGHTTIANGAPIAFGKTLWIKTLVVLAGFLLTVLAGSFILLLTLAPRYGIGSLNLPVPVYYFELQGITFDLIPIGQWLVQALILLSLSALMLVRGIMLLSVVVKQEFFNLIVGVSVLFTESLYFSRGIGYFSDIGLLPPTFFSIGSVLMGYHNFLYNSADITFMNGVLSLGAAWLIIEVLLYILTRFRRFRRI